MTHGNGPQVGLLALQAAAGQNGTPLDVLGAESDGMIGYVLAQELGNAMAGREVATVLTQVVVEPTDPAFDRPTKPMGPPALRRPGRAGRSDATARRGDASSPRPSHGRSSSSSRSASCSPPGSS